MNQLFGICQTFGIWKVGYEHNSYLVAIPSATKELATALPLIEKYRPSSNFQVYDHVEFLGTCLVDVPETNATKPVSKPDVDWLLFPSWAIAFAIDQSGAQYVYGGIPSTHDGMDDWSSPVWRGSIRLPSKLEIPWDGDWKDSLVIRPEIVYPPGAGNS